jgi:hypothetical protein
MSIESAIRTPLKTALSGIAANVYNGIPETMTSPSICLIPDAPYLESVLIGKNTTKVKVNLTVTGVVGYANNRNINDFNHCSNAKWLRSRKCKSTSTFGSRCR